VLQTLLQNWQLSPTFLIFLNIGVHRDNYFIFWFQFHFCQLKLKNYRIILKIIVSMCVQGTQIRTQQQRTTDSWFKIFLNFRIIVCSSSQKLKIITSRFKFLNFSIFPSLLYKNSVPTPFWSPSLGLVFTTLESQHLAR
jgi:hypothetical protein